MMQHLTTQTLTDYLHGELAPGRDASVLAHLESCAKCTRELEIEAALTERLRAAARAEELELPLGFASAVMARLEDEGRRNPFERFVRRLRPAFVLPLAGAVALAAFLVVAPMTRHANLPGQTLPVAYLLEEHAAHAQENPLSDRSAGQMLTAGFERSSQSSSEAAAPMMQMVDTASLSNDGAR